MSFVTILVFELSGSVLLEGDPCLEGNIADGKADPAACYQLSHWPGIFLAVF